MKGFSLDAGRATATEAGPKVEPAPAWPSGSVAAVRAMLLRLGTFAILAIVGGVIYGQAPLYTSNQNQYFLHGFARAGMGLLRHDWLATTVDPTPIFSFLVELTTRYLHEGLFFVYFMVLAGVYFSGLIGLTLRTVPVDASRTRLAAYVMLLLGIHSALLAALSLPTLGIDLRAVFTNGVAGQFLMGDILQPSMAGVFLIASIHAFAQDRRKVAVVHGAAAAILHPAYLLAAGVLILSYVLVIIKETRDTRQAVGIGILGALLLLPMAAYVVVAFRPTSPSAWAAAQDVLMNVRLQHHALVHRWLGTPAYVQMVLVCAGLVVARRSPRLFAVLLISTVVAVVLTVVQVVSGSPGLALLFPWRLSVYVVPVAISVLAAALVSWFDSRFVKDTAQRERLLTWGCAVALVLLMVGGWQYTQRLADEDRQDASVPVMDFVRRTKSLGDLYLIPPVLERFRLYTGAPVFVDRKSIPYKDVELVEWVSRSETAWGLSRLNDPALVCQTLSDVLRRYAVTHVVLRRAQTDGTCGRLHPGYEDAEYGVYRVTAR